MERCTEHFVTLHSGTGITSKCAAARGGNSKYQKKQTRWSLRSLLEFAVLVDKKFFANKPVMDVAKNKMPIYESSSDSSQQYCNTGTVHRVCEKKLVSCECSCKQSVWEKRHEHKKSQLVF